MKHSLFLGSIFLALAVALPSSFGPPPTTIANQPAASPRPPNCGCRNSNSITVPGSCICTVTLSGIDNQKGTCDPTDCNVPVNSCHSEVVVSLGGGGALCTRPPVTLQCNAACLGNCNSNVACATGVLVELNVNCLECGTAQ